MIPTALGLIAHRFPGHNGIFVLKNIEEFMIEFAKLHVEEALKVVSENAETTFDSAYNVIPNRESILNAYLLTNIK